MENVKKRLLVVSEFSGLSTGYARLGFELLSRFHASGKYEIFELAKYGVQPVDREKLRNIPWKVYGCLPNTPEDEKVYNSNPVNQFGAYKFESTLLDCQPTHVLEFSDPWMYSYQENSPFRKFFSWILCPTLDAVPQSSQWLESYKSADILLTYNDWAYDVLRSSHRNFPQLLNSASPACSTEFTPLPDRKKRKLAILGRDCFVIGTVMRNQPRKDFPGLFEAFAKLLKETNRTDIYLYCHTNIPDMGWDIPDLLKRSGIGNRVFFTYQCKDCKFVFPSVYQDIAIMCPKCHGVAGTSSTRMPITNSQLCEIYNLFDLYIQAANCLTPNQQVLSEDGWKSISDIKIGDSVLTHKNRFRNVTNIFDRKIDESILKITPYSDYERLEITKEHPVLVLDTEHNSRSKREKVGELIHRGTFSPKFKFVEAKDLKPRDILVYPIDMAVKDIMTFDIEPFNDVKDSSNTDMILGRYGKNINRIIDIDDDFLKFIGLFAADGSATGNSGCVGITSNINEIENIDLCKRVFIKINGKYGISTYKNRAAKTVYASSKILHRVFESWFKKGIHKQLPEWVMKLPVERQKIVLIGMFMGDGHTSVRRGISTSIYATISHKLAEQLKTILRRLKVNFNSRYITKKCNDNKKRQKQYWFELYGDIKHSHEILIVRNNSRNFYYENNHFIQIKSIEEVEYSGIVHNFETEEDNSYCTKIGIVHNCEGQGLPQCEAAACGIPIMSTDYSAMSDVVRKLGGYPIPVIRHTKEAASSRLFGWMDMNNVVEYWKQFIQIPNDEREKLGILAHYNYHKHYNYNKTAQIWMNAIDSVRPELDWKSPLRFFNPNTNVPQGLNNKDYVRWLILNVLGQPEKAYSLFEAKLVKDVSFNCTSGHNGAPQPYSRKMAFDTCLNIRNHFNHWENQRKLRFGL